MRVDLARYAEALKTCRNFFVRATGGISNRAGLQYVATLNPDSEGLLVPFVFSTEQAYMLVFQEESIQVFANGAFVDSTAPPLTVTNVEIVTESISPLRYRRKITTSGAHGLIVGQQITISGINGSGDYAFSGATTVIEVTSSTSFKFGKELTSISGSYVSGGSVVYSVTITTDYQSDDLASIRYTQSADVMTLVHKDYVPSEFARTDATAFTFGEITDFTEGPFLDFDDNNVTMTSSAATGTGVTLTASAAVFNSGHVGSLIRIDLKDVSGIQPWEASKLLAAAGDNPLNKFRRSLEKVYRCVTNEVASGDGTYTGTIRPSHDEGVEADGDGNPITNLAARAGVNWQYEHVFYGIARITAVAVNGLTATANVIHHIPVVSPATTTVWAFGAWSEDQGYPSVVTYYGDRLVFANTPQQPQTQWASKVGEYHDFGESSPLVDDDSIAQTLNARQANPILEMVPLEQLVSLTPSSSWATPARGEALTPTTIGFYKQSHKGSASRRAIEVGDEGALHVARGSTKLYELTYAFNRDKYGGNELTVLSRHLFGPTRYIVDMDYSEEPHGILWLVRSDGALIGLTYLPEQQVVGWHRHDTDGFFERVCVIPEDGRDAVYVIVRRTVGGATVRYLERMANREIEDQVDGFFVDSGLTYDGRNATATTITVTGASYEGGEDVTVTASAVLFSSDDVGDAILFEDARIIITGWTGGTIVTGQLQTPLPAALQAIATTEWTFARDSFSGLDHLEGAAVTICADGAVLDQQVVTDGQVTIANPAGVVHIGLPYTAEAELLDVTIFGAAETVRDRKKIIPMATVVVQDTVGLKVGPDSSNMETLAVRVDEYYTDPTAALSGVATGYMLNTWNDNGRLILRQDDPLPATILAVIPKVEFGT